MRDLVIFLCFLAVGCNRKQSNEQAAAPVPSNISEPQKMEATPNDFYQNKEKEAAPADLDVSVTLSFKRGSASTRESALAQLPESTLTYSMKMSELERTVKNGLSCSLEKVTEKIFKCSYDNLTNCRKGCEKLDCIECFMPEIKNFEQVLFPYL